MGGSTTGVLFRVTTFGESHGRALGAVIDGVPPGLKVTEEMIQRDLDRRKPGQSLMTTPRQEPDRVEILSGLFEGKTTGCPLALEIRNTSQRSKDYGAIKDLYRPGHADLSYDAKYGFRDYRGGGRASGRETAARVAAGAVAKTLLAKQGISILCWTEAVGTVSGKICDPAYIEANPVRAADPDMTPGMVDQIAQARKSGDSVGGIVAGRITGVPVGWGEPVFDKLDGDLAKALMSLGGVKGIEIGDGFSLAALKGSEANDQMEDGNFLTNRAGGILGGISSGAPITFRIAVKPTPSISVSQKTRTRTGENANIETHGRHDPCLCPRIVPAAEAGCALVLADMALRQNAIG